MSFTNINDPAGVSALLEKLRSSQAWTDLQAQRTSEPKAEPSQTTPTVQQRPTEVASNNGGSRPSVACLLSQLSSTSSVPPSSTVSSLQGASLGSSSSTPHSTTPVPPMASSSRQTKDLRSYTFQQALPHLAQLSDDPAFVDAILKLRRDQNNLEKQLWEERQAIHAKQAEKVKVEVTKANIVSSGISEARANAMRREFEEELSKFDQERVMRAWDALIARQQAALEKLGVPAMFVTEEGSDRERQQRIIQVLEGIVGSGESDGAL